MEYITDSFKEIISTLNENQQEEIDVVESIINTNKSNKERTSEKVKSYIKKRGLSNSHIFILKCIERATIIRPKEREPLFFVVKSIFESFELLPQINDKIFVIKDMMAIKGLYQDHTVINKHAFDFEEVGTVQRAIFDDDIDELQQLLAVQYEGVDNKNFELGTFFPFQDIAQKFPIDRIGTAAFLGSIKCFKYLMINGDQINDGTCKYAISGGNNEIVHIFEQKGFQFSNCLFVSITFHRFELFEWLRMHFSYNSVTLARYIACFNEPAFYFYISNESNIREKNKYGYTPILIASENGIIEIVKYLHEKFNSDVEIKNSLGFSAINSASCEGCIDAVKYLYETCHADIESKDKSGRTPINNASFYDRIDIVKYLNEKCHANIETQDKNGMTPLNNASKRGNLDIVEYLFENCNVDIETRDNEGLTPINNASKFGHIEVVVYLYETCHADLETKDDDGWTPLNNAHINCYSEIADYLNIPQD